MQPGSSNLQTPSYPEGGSIGNVKNDVLDVLRSIYNYVSILTIFYFEYNFSGVPLEECPLSSTPVDLEMASPNCTSNASLVPLVVKICTSIVEEKGLEIVGIYRVPGNNASVTYLTELINKGPDNVEVISCAS